MVFIIGLFLLVIQTERGKTFLFLPSLPSILLPSSACSRDTSSSHGVKNLSINKSPIQGASIDELWLLGREWETSITVATSCALLPVLSS